MAEENKNIKSNNLLKINLPNNSDGIIAIQNFASGVSDVFDALKEYGKVMKNISETDFDNYSKFLSSELKSKNNNIEVLHFLVDEKHKVEEHINVANFKKNGLDRKYYEDILQFLILPMINKFEELIELNKRLPMQQKEELLPSQNENIGNTESLSRNHIIINKDSDSVTQFSEMPSGFSQISCNATKEEILNYFMILAKEQNRLMKAPFMAEADVIKMVNKNFTAFENIPTNEYFPINLGSKQKGILRHFLYQFYCKFEPSVKDAKLKYAHFLIYNFEIFKNDDPHVLCSNMGESKRPEKTFIDIKKYIKR